MKEQVFCVFDADKNDRSYLAAMSRKEIFELAIEDNEAKIFDLEELTCMLNDDCCFTTEWVFVGEHEVQTKDEVENIEERTWTVSIEDFSDYDITKLTDGQKRSLVYYAAKGVVDNDCVSDCFWASIRDAAEEFGLSKSLETLCSDHFADFYRAGVNVKEYFPECQEEKDPDFLGIAVPDDCDRGKWLEKAGYYTEEHSTPFVTDDGDRYDEFDVVYVYKAKKEEDK